MKERVINKVNLNFLNIMYVLFKCVFIGEEVKSYSEQFQFKSNRQKIKQKIK